MESIIEELYSYFCPNTNLTGENPAYTDAVRLMDKNRNKLLALLDEQEREIFERYCKRQCDADDFVRFDRFSCGLRVGARLMAEVFASD